MTEEELLELIERSESLIEEFTGLLERARKSVQEAEENLHAAKALAVESAGKLADVQRSHQSLVEQLRELRGK